MPQWKRVLGIDEDLEDIETSIKYGLQILGFYREMYKDLDVALTAYNRGPGAVDAALMRGADPKNNYAPTVLERYAYFRALNNPPS
jgi:soluble lytic murein transglycosylase-like protein